MKMLYVNEITCAREIGGSITHDFNTIESIRNQGHDVLAVFPENTDREITENRYRYRTLRSIFPSKIISKIRDMYEIYYDFKFASTLKNIMEKYMPDIIFERSTFFHQSCANLAKQFSTPYIVEIHAPVEERKWAPFNNFSWLADHIQNTTIKRADAIIVVASPMVDYLKNKGVKKKIFYIPNAVDPKPFTPSHKSKVLKKKMGMDRKVIIGFVGTMKKYHGIDILINAAHYVIETYKNVRFLIVGPFDDEQKTKLFKESDMEKLIDYFIFTGKVKYIDIPKYISMMDICVVPKALWNGTPIKIFEYGAMGKAIIVPKMKHLLELLRFPNALFSEPDDCKSLADNIITLIGQKDLRRRLGSNLRKLVLSKYTWDKNAEKIIKIASNIIASPNIELDSKIILQKQMIKR